MRSDERSYDPIKWARYAGQQAREHGRDLKSCPLYEMGRDGTELRKAWEAGFNEASRLSDKR